MVTFMIKYFHYSTLFKRKVKVTYLQLKLYSCSPVAAVAPHRRSLLKLADLLCEILTFYTECLFQISTIQNLDRIRKNNISQL
jgi:hypothetical protein